MFYSNISKKTLFSALFLAVLLLVFPAQLQAKEVAGRIGLGLDNTLNAASFGVGSAPSTPNSPNAPSTGISVKYWINNDWGVAGVFGFFYGSSNVTTYWVDDKDSIWGFTFDAKGFYNFAKSEMANMALFADFHMQKENETTRRPSGSYQSSLGISLGFGFAPEIYITDSFALNAEFGLIFRIQEGFGFAISGDNLLGGVGFHYYF